MPQDSNSNAPSSDKTSSSAPKTPLGESAYLTKQAADAKAAIARAVDDLKHELATTADPRAWMQVHPWATLGAAAVAGFAAASMMIPSKQEQALKRLAAIEKALNPKHRDAAEATNGEGVQQVQSGKQSFFAGLAGQILHAVQPVLMSAITAGVTAKAAKDQPPTGGAPPAGYDAPPNAQKSSTSDPSI